MSGKAPNSSNVSVEKQCGCQRLTERSFIGALFDERVEDKRGEREKKRGETELERSRKLRRG